MAYGNVNVAVPGVSNDESSYLKTEQAGAPGGGRIHQGSD